MRMIFLSFKLILFFKDEKRQSAEKISQLENEKMHEESQKQIFELEKVEISSYFPI